MTRKKILFTIINLNVGGSEMSLYRILQSLDREKFEAVVASLKGKGDVGPMIESLGIPVHVFGVTSIASYFFCMPRLARLIRSENPDILQGWLYHANLASLVAKWIAGSTARVFWSIRNTLNAPSEISRSPIFMRVLVALSAVLSSRVDTVIFNSALARDDHRKAGFRSADMKVIPNGIDPDLWSPEPRMRPPLRLRLGLAPATPIVGLLARFDPTKDHDNFLRAARLVADRNPEVHFVLAGPNVTSENRTLTGLVSELRLKGRVHLIGQTLDNRELTQGLNVSCCSSLTESFPNTVLEAMACGVFCVSTDVGDVRDILGGAGTVVPARNAAALGEALLAALSLPENDRERRVQIGLKSVREKFTLRAVAAEFQTAYGS